MDGLVQEYAELNLESWVLMNTFQTKMCHTIVGLSILALPISWIVLPGVGSAYRALTIMLYLLFALIVIRSNGKINIYKETIALVSCWIVYTVLVVISTLFSPNSDRVVESIFGYGLVMLTAIVFSVCLPETTGQWLDRIWLITGVIWILLFFTSGQNILQFSTRVSLVLLGNRTDPNEYVGALIVPVCLMVYQIVKPCKFQWKLGAILGIGVSVYIAFLAGSRGGLLALLIGIVMTFLTSSKLSLRRIIALSIFSIVLIYFVLYGIMPMLSEELVTRFTIESIISTGGSDRTVFWTQAWDNFKSCNVWRMLFGYGGYGADFMNKTMHNQIIQQLVDFGLVGMICYLVLILLAYLQIRKYSRRYLGAFFGMMAMSMSITMGPSYKPLWIFLMMGFVIPKGNGEYDVRNARDVSQ